MCDIAFFSFENAEDTTRFGLPLGKPNTKLVSPHNTQIFGLKRPAQTLLFSILNLSHSFLNAPALGWQILPNNKIKLKIGRNQVVVQAVERGIKLHHNSIGTRKNEVSIQTVP